MNFQDLLTKIKAIDEAAPAALGAMAAQAVAKKIQSGPKAVPASSDNPYNSAELGDNDIDARNALAGQNVVKKECGDDEMNPKAVMPGGDDELLTGECGGMMDVTPSAPKQSDSVTMNVSMNGSGAGGIKDLLDILRNIEKSGGQDSDDVLVGIGAEEDFDNTPNPTQVPTPDSGDDLHREKDEYKKANGGGNPMRMHETLVAKLSQKYADIKGE